MLRTYVGAADAGEWLAREVAALGSLEGTGVRAPELVGVEMEGECPSLLMTHLEGRTVLADAGIEDRVPLLARQLVAIHRVRPVERPRTYVALTTPESVVVPEGADWGAAVEVIRGGPPAYEGRFLHRDFQPGNVLFEGGQISGVVDWAGASWGPAELDVAHCAVNLALLHGPEWGLRFATAYQDAGGVLGADLTYWMVRDALAASEEVQAVSQPWREAGRSDLTTSVVEQRLVAYVTLLMR